MFDDSTEFSAFDTTFLNAYSQSPLSAAIRKAKDQILGLQASEGYWVFELEADCTIPSEYILMMHYMDEIDTELQAKLPATSGHVSRKTAVIPCLPAVTGM